MALFGRDSLITAYQALPFQPHLARTTLEALTAWQATELDDFRDAEPGKILHELRLGELTMLGERPHSPYYGTHDATPLFLILLDEYERWAGDRDFVRSLQPAAMMALEWIERYGDRDGDGYLEYQTRSKEGLANQCWQDSWNSILFKDGAVAKGPIATCETQATPTTRGCGWLGWHVMSGTTRNWPAASNMTRRHCGSASTGITGSRLAATTRSRSTAKSGRSTL